QGAKAAIEVLAEHATGTVSVGMYKGNLYFQSLTECPASLYNEEDSSMEASDGLNPMSSQGYADIMYVEAVALAKAGQIKS
ncbi:MAG: argininosuccinate synthase, partial [Paraglaciecola psychrophila]